MLYSDSSGAFRRLVSAHVGQRSLGLALFNGHFDSRVQSILTITFGAASLVLALMLQLLFRKKD
jgi:hypothetical protein